MTTLDTGSAASPEAAPPIRMRRIVLTVEVEVPERDDWNARTGSDGFDEPGPTVLTDTVDRMVSAFFDAFPDESVYPVRWSGKTGRVVEYAATAGDEPF